MDYVILLHNDEKERDELPLGGIFVVDCVDRDERSAGPGGSR
jgi:hypothetical protein